VDDHQESIAPARPSSLGSSIVGNELLRTSDLSRIGRTAGRVVVASHRAGGPGEASSNLSGKVRWLLCAESPVTENKALRSARSGRGRRENSSSMGVRRVKKMNAAGGKKGRHPLRSVLPAGTG
jgi:hypothetical protein